MARGALPPPAPDGGYPGQNTAEGLQALKNLNYTPTSGDAQNNTAVGFEALFATSTGTGNTGIGTSAMASNTTGDYNTGVGEGALHCIPGQGQASYNTAIGVSALFSNNGNYNTASGYAALTNNYSGYSNTATGASALYSNSSGYDNTAQGISALQNNTSGNYNTATGASALTSNINGSNNTANGLNALYFNSNGHDNTADGLNALLNNTSGSNNTALGARAGSNVTTGNNNIIIGASVLGNASDANVTRIGNSTQKKTFIGGIYNKTVASGIGVIINSAGQLGTVQSSARYKDDIKAMDRGSEAVLKLRPVTFRYKEDLDPDKIPQFGLIAEEVEKVNPDLVMRDEDGKVNTVRYEAVNAMLLNEFLKNYRTDQDQGRKLQEQELTIAKLQTLVAQQQKQIETLSATVRRVSERVEVGARAPRVAANDE